MAKRGREAMAKRARERARQEKKDAKREKREARSDDDTAELSDADQAALMEEFARLSERYDSNQISQAFYDEERDRIFTELGIETE